MFGALGSNKRMKVEDFNLLNVRVKEISNVELSVVTKKKHTFATGT